MTWISTLVLQTRWILLPVYLGLVPAALVYMYKYFRQLLELIQGVTSLSDDQLLLSVLHLLDMVMVVNLLIVSIIGGFSLFVQRVTARQSDGTPLGWLEHMDPISLKVKLGMALIGVSSIHLLEAFVGAASKSWDELGKLIVIHAVFVLSTLAVAKMSYKAKASSRPQSESKH